MESTDSGSSTRFDDLRAQIAQDAAVERLAKETSRLLEDFKTLKQESGSEKIVLADLAAAMLNTGLAAQERMQAADTLAEHFDRLYMHYLDCPDYHPEKFSSETIRQAVFIHLQNENASSGR